MPDPHLPPDTVTSRRPHCRARRRITVTALTALALLARDWRHLRNHA